jgi:glyoxylase-like metal-dependent hydrolase (beta-lactamase superfamily II)
LLIDRVVAAYFETNCWIIATGVGQEAIIVDPGIGKPNLVNNIVEKIKEHNLKPVAVLITHGHLDHFFSVLPLTKEIPMRTYITGSDRFLLTDPMGALDRGGVSHQLISAFGSNFKEPDDVIELEDFSHFEIAGLNIGPIFAPGHKPILDHW